MRSLINCFKFLLILISPLSILLLTACSSLQKSAPSMKPEGIIVPVSVLGEVSEVRKRMLQNSLNDELSKTFRIVPQERFEAAKESAFQELDYDQCTEDQCIMMIQEMLQVENAFHLQVIGDGNDTQLNLSWRTLDEKKNETETGI